MNWDEIYLTEHFTLKEMCVTSHEGFVNIPSAQQIRCLENVCCQLEKLRSALGGRPLKISSGFRCEELNHHVGGAKNSFHTSGCAADIVCDDLNDACRKMATMARVCVDFDELFIEGNLNTERVWLHFAYAPYSPPLRKCGFISK